MKATFTGNPNKDAADEAKVCELFGMTFYKGQPVDVSELPEAQRAKLRGNRHFTVEDGEQPKRKPGRPRKDVAEPSTEDQAVDENES